MSSSHSHPHHHHHRRPGHPDHHQPVSTPESSGDRTEASLQLGDYDSPAHQPVQQDTVQTASTPLYLDQPFSSSSSPSSTPKARRQVGETFVLSDPRQLYHVSSHSHGQPTAQILNHSRSQVPDPLNLLDSFESLHPRYYHSGLVNAMNQDRSAHSLHRGASANTTQGYECPNCSKVFARDDLLRRHLAREARAQAQPSLDRQKSCYECARSKARCDLEVPSCGRCQSRGKSCVYGARSGNPNVQRGMRETQEPGIGGPSNWPGTPPVGESWTGSQDYSGGAFVKSESKRSADEYESSDESRNWSDSFHHYRAARALSTSSTSTSGSFDPNHAQHGFESGYSSDFNVTGTRSESPAHFASSLGPSQAVAQPSQLARGFAHSGAKTNIDTSVSGGINGEEGELTPISRANTVPMTSGMNPMGPPLLTPTRYRDANLTFGGSAWDPSLGVIPSSSHGSILSKPQPPRLLTGAKMPKPQDGQQGATLSSSRPLFSAQLDLSGWLEEPVVPSPLYRMGPSLSALGAGPVHGAFTTSTPTNNGMTAEALRSALAINPPLPPPIPSSRSGEGAHATTNPSSSDTVMEHNDPSHKAKGVMGRDEEAETETQVAARQWWARSMAESHNDVDLQGVAQACAGHFTIYPALMVLPDPTSPVPPLFHRPWLAHSRLHTPAPLARTRVLLAGYHVKLPSSESMVWDMIAMEANTIVASFDQLVTASDLEVFSSTAALWFLIILLLMSSDPSSGANIPESLVDSGLIGLSRFSHLLSQRIKACEEGRSRQSTSPSYLDWGFEETMKRTLFASYSLLVLQRFRETSTEIQSQIAGIDLILDIQLPATAMDFEAGDELQWRASQHVQINDSPDNGLPRSITIRDLIKMRKEGGSEEKRKRVTSYFDRHDDFTNVCLSVAFALDRGLA